MLVTFEKWHGCKNDFILLWLTANDGKYLEPSLQRQAAHLCQKEGGGIGADGILLCYTNSKSDPAPTAVKIINADGSFASNCGNGLRCAAASTWRRYEELGQHASSPEALELKVGEHSFWCERLGDGEKGQPYVAVSMPGVKLGKDLSWYQAAESEVKKLSQELAMPELASKWFACEISNRHLVFYLDSPDLNILAVAGSRLQQTSAWDGINVHLVGGGDRVGAPAFLRSTLSDESLQALSWERGVGPTAACGSGACAIAATYLNDGWLEKGKWLPITMPGGTLYCQGDNLATGIKLAGPTTFVFSGQIEV